MSHRHYAVNTAVDQDIAAAYARFTAGHERGAIRQCAQKLRVPRWWVTRRAKTLGLARVKELPWSEAELAILRENRHYSPPKIRQFLKALGFERSEYGILLKRKRLKLTTRNGADGYTGRSLAAVLNIDSHSVSRWIKTGLLAAGLRCTARRQAQGGDWYWIKMAEFRRFVFANPELIDVRKVDGPWFIEMLRGEAGNSDCEEEHF